MTSNATQIIMTEEKLKGVYDALKDSFAYKNALAAPSLVKVVVSVGTGSRMDKRKRELVGERLAKITGQKPSIRGAKKSVATFKVREGDPVGYAITLRGAQMRSFVDKLIHVALPRTRDFKGIAKTSIDEMGNLSIGLKEHTIFPETADEDLKDVFGLAITIVSTAKDPKEALAFYEFLGIPFTK